MKNSDEKIDISKLTNREIFDLAFPTKKSNNIVDSSKENIHNERKYKANSAFAILSDIFPSSVSPESSFQKLKKMSDWASVLFDRSRGFDITYEENMQAIDLVRAVKCDLALIESDEKLKAILISYGGLIYKVLDTLENRLIDQSTAVTESTRDSIHKEISSEPNTESSMQNLHTKNGHYSIGDDLPPEMM